ncbi:MAG: DUF2845 domain-containing protein [Rudaea sp.]|uniref:DUF2845 domain-containing protein n=1 Tax=unclassified Rudaea TaxID=2627037 RepID=UPI0010F5E073|nr:MULTISPECIES: DUF2845 domain-containing protein [unclassified Rudaea]MBN8886775.1 DUF2845 domain-containing protein [Rudaea sp.]MBR0347821.1 DUF2845 domain-containing protein [Rudaea sp.]
MCRYLLLALVLLFASPHAFALRCGNMLVTKEIQDFQVRDRCGDPFWTESYTNYDLLGSQDNGQIAREVQYDVWYYNFGPSNLMHRLVFRDGILKQDDTLAYGVRELGTKCDPLMRFVDLSVGELVAFCGEPLTRRQNNDTVVNRLAPGYRRIREQRRELWTYDMGENRFLRQLQLVEGRVVSIRAIER